MKWSFALLALSLLFSTTYAQEAVVEVIAADAFVDDEAVEDGEVVEEGDAIIALEAVEAEGGGIVEQAVEGFFNLIGVAPARQVGQPPKEAYTKNVDEIDKAELDKLEKQLTKDPNLQGMMPHYKMQFKNQCNGELRLMHLVCGLTRSEFLEIEKDAKLASKRGLLSICQQQAKMMQGLGMQAKDQKKLTPNERMEKALLKAAERELDDEQVKLYKSELAERFEFRKESMVEMLATALDSIVILSEEQRPLVIKLFKDEWATEWLNATQYLTNSGIQYVPKIPKNGIRKLLTDEQKEVFKTIRWAPQNGVQYFNGFNIFGFGQNQQRELKDELEFAPEPNEDVAEDTAQ